MDYNLKYSINKTNKCFDITSKHFKRGKDEILFDCCLFENKQMLQNGYIITKFPKQWRESIKQSISSLIVDRLAKAGVQINNQDFALDQYHTYVDDKTHLRVVNSFRAGFFGTGGFDLTELGIDYKELDDFINNSIQSTSRLSCKIKKFGLTHGKFWIRIVRPNSNDNNPPHRDSHLKRLRKNVNIYLPLAGSNKLSSLPLIPKSHLEKENQYIVSASPSYVNGKKNTVPCIVHRDGGIKMICPNPKPNEILIFTPHIVHGGGINLNKDVTRVSLEMRFFK